MEAKIGVLQRQLTAKAENEDAAKLIEENARLKQENRELGQELYDIQENNPQLQAALEDRKELKRENGELHARIELLEQQLKGEDQPLLGGDLAEAHEPLPFKRGIFRDWEASGDPLSLAKGKTGQTGNRLGAIFIDDSDDDDAVPVMKKADAFRPIGDGDDVGLLDEDSDNGSDDGR
jgi:hypothetical protein